MKITRQVLIADGRSTRAEEKLLTIEVKPGWKAGTKVTFPREGDQAASTIPADVVFVIRDKPHPVFTRDGADIKYRAKVSLRDVRTIRIHFPVSLVLLVDHKPRLKQPSQCHAHYDHLVDHHALADNYSVATKQSQLLFSIASSNCN